jgi:hypothetical protein
MQLDLTGVKSKMKQDLNFPNGDVNPSPAI